MKYKTKNNNKNKDFIEIYGLHAIEAALKNNLRKHGKLIITRKNKANLDKNLLDRPNEIVELSIREINKLYGSEFTHQGIILKTSKLIQPSLKEIIQNTNQKKEIIVMLDHVSDPNNIGSIMRSCSLFNCKSLIVTKDNSPDITPAITKAASGALEIVNYIRVTNLSRTIEKFKRNNFWVIGLDNNKSKFQKKFEIPKKCLLILGAEGKGLRDLTKKECDEIQTIPIKYNSKYKIESLNVSNACTVALYQHYISN